MSIDVIDPELKIFRADDGRRHRAAKEKPTIKKRDEAAPVHGTVPRWLTCAMNVTL